MQAVAMFSHRGRQPWRAVLRAEPGPDQFRGAELWRSGEHFSTWQAAQAAAEAELRRRESTQ